MHELYEQIRSLLQQDKRLVKDGKLLKNKVVELSLQLDPALMKTLLGNAAVKRHFFQEVGATLVFDRQKFQRFVSNKAFLPDSYTAFKNRIGLQYDDDFLVEGKEVVLAWPYKDCVLEGGQTKEDSKRDEVFWNETLAPEEIDRLLTPKTLTKFVRYSSEKSGPATAVSTKDNFVIRGNNLLSLCTLKKLFPAKVKLIYIDPPYNTGKDSFGYNDSFNHSAWLTFIKNRVELAKDLLRPDGVIFISVDINEQGYLKVLCDEIFTRRNFVGEIIWETATDNNATQISVEHEHILCYAKNIDNQDEWQIKSEKAQYIQEKYLELKKKYKADYESIEKDLRSWINGMKKSNDVDLSGVSHYAYVDKKGVYYPGNSANTRPGGYTYDIHHPKTKRVCKKPEYGYRWPERTFWEADKNGDVLWGDDEMTIPKIKKRLDTATELLKGYYYEDNRRSTKALIKLMGKKVFDNPKSVNLLKKIVKFTTSSDDIVLDFFAGAGSTAEAVLAANAEEGTNRRFILCEQLDYIEKVTVRRIQKCLGVHSFVFCELASLNQTLIDRIQLATSARSLMALWDEIKAKGLISWRVNIDALEKGKSDLERLDMDAIKRILIELLDKNQLYVPLSEMDDEDYQITKKDRELCKSLFSQSREE